MKRMYFCYPTIFPIKAGFTFFLDQVSNHQEANLIAYQRPIAKLMYLSCETHSDITFLARQLSCLNSNLRVEYLYITKWVLHYLKKTISLAIKWENNPTSHWSSKRYKQLGVVGYVDSNYVKNLEEKKSITRYWFFLGRVIVTWYNKQQRTVSISILEAKYVAVS